MEAEPIDVFALKANQERPEFVNPGKGAFNYEAVLIDIPIKVPFSAAFAGLAIAFIFINIGNNTIIPEHFANYTGIKATVSIEHSTLIAETIALHVLKELFEGSFHIIDIVMITSHNIGRCDNVSIGIDQREDVTRLGLFSSLVCDAFAPFLATLWLPSRLSADKFNSYLMAKIPASKSRWKLPSRLHLRK